MLYLPVTKLFMNDMEKGVDVITNVVNCFALQHAQDNRYPIEEVKHPDIFPILVKEDPVLNASDNTDKLQEDGYCQKGQKAEPCQ